MISGFRVATLRVAMTVVIAACTGAGEDETIPGEPDALSEGAAPATLRADLGEAFDVPYGSTAVVGNGRLAIEFRRVVEESRCPEDVQCPTAGNAAVELAVEAADGPVATLVLNTSRPPDGGPVENLYVRLAGLEPHPRVAGAPVDTTDYVATLEVTDELSPGEEAR